MTNCDIISVSEDLELLENAETEDAVIIALIAAMRDYANDFYQEFSLWSSAPNRKSHVPYIMKILVSSDHQLREDMICQNGRN